MSLTALIIVFAVTSLFWVWIIFLGGADTLEGSVISAFIIGADASFWSAEQIKAYACLLWFFEGVWFAISLFVPVARFMR